MNTRVDVAIIGAGPAGLIAAHTFLKEKTRFSCAMIEKNPDGSLPIACAEGVGARGFHDVLTPHPSWIRSTVQHAQFFAPDATCITYTDRHKSNGYIINRAIMQRDLLFQLQDSGISLSTGRKAISLTAPEPSGYRTIVLEDGSTIESRVVIDCAGPHSRFGKDEHIECKSSDQEIAYFAHIKNPNTLTDRINIYVGSHIAPGGYGWLFPQSQSEANVGIVIGAMDTKQCNVRTLLADFIKNYFHDAEILSTMAGPIPCYTGSNAKTASGFIKAGDAARSVNPISRAGIVEAMKSGRLAAQTALAMLSVTREKDMVKICRNHEKLWDAILGKTHAKLAKVKTHLHDVTDEEYNIGSHALAKIRQDKLTMSKIFTTCLGKFPSLVFSLRYLM